MRHLAAILVLTTLLGCTRQPSPQSLAGMWTQDGDYVQSQTKLGAVFEALSLEDYELCFASNSFSATCIVAPETPKERRVYWSGPFTITNTPSGEYWLAFATHEGEPIQAKITFAGRRLVLDFGKRRIGLLRGDAINLRIKGLAR
jgi:hypothetical protein